MNIHIDGETERLIQSALASGEFSSAEDFVAAMANRWNEEKNPSRALQSRRAICTYRIFETGGYRMHEAGRL